MSPRRDTVTPLPRRARAASPPQPPPSRRAPRAAPARRPVRRLTKWLIALGLIVTVLAFGAQWLLRSSYFRVQHVELSGLRHEGDVAVLDASGLLAHPSMIGLNEEQITKRLEAFPWINAVTITKHWPNTVVLAVRESVAVAVAFTSTHHLEFVDAQGRELGPAAMSVNLPTLEYLDPKGTTWPFERAGRAAAYVASQLPRAFNTQVAQVTDDAQGVVTLKMTTPLTFILGPATNLHAKFVAIASVIAHSTLVPGDVVDVTVPDELAVTPPSS